MEQVLDKADVLADISRPRRHRLSTLQSNFDITNHVNSLERFVKSSSSLLGEGLGALGEVFVLTCARFMSMSKRMQGSPTKTV